ncbi:F pilus assembly protein traF [Legionella busanensis]|uniref:F pilus assembly protein traF n=1 Tax=Legionella busanensis TaxID=190655 RepID=A0A378KCB9_9GAMM|nr:type-F conjugative transfer system pilin assembly protein TraF [Legionella busanensis]STX81265.1 F pilus assembly protein traF [Legionella busanensis]
MKLIFTFLLLIPLIVCADMTEHKAHGFHWYSTEAQEPERIIKLQKPPAKESLEPYEELLAKRKQTMNLLAESLLRPSVEKTTAYISAQQEMAERHQKFVQNWERALLMNPQLDHRLNVPTDNNAIATKNDEQKILTEAIISESAKRFGLIFVYQGSSTLAQRFSSVLLLFVKEHNFAMIPVSVDGVMIPEITGSKIIPLAFLASKLPVKQQYLPALFLVNLKTQQLSPLSYGFIALSDLKTRFLDVATDFKRFSYAGLGV